MALDIFDRLGASAPEVWTLVGTAAIVAVATGFAMGWSTRRGDAGSVGVSGAGVTLRLRKGGEHVIPWASVVDVSSPSRWYLFGVKAYLFEYSDAKGGHSAQVVLREPAAAISKRLAPTPPERGVAKAQEPARRTVPMPSWLTGGVEAVWVDSFGDKIRVQVVPGPAQPLVRWRAEYDRSTRELLKEAFGEVRGEAEIGAVEKWHEETYEEYMTSSYAELLIDVSRPQDSQVLVGTPAEHLGTEEVEFKGRRYACLKLRTRAVSGCACVRAGRRGRCAVCGGRRRLVGVCPECGGSGKCRECGGTGQVRSETFWYFESSSGLCMGWDKWVGGEKVNKERLEGLTPDILPRPS